MTSERDDQTGRGHETLAKAVGETGRPIAACDLDRTLLNSDKYFEYILKAIHEVCGVEPAAMRAQRNELETRGETFVISRQLATQGYSDEQWRAVEARMDEYYADPAVRQDSLMPEADEMLAALAEQGFTIFIVTTGDLQDQANKLRRVGLDRYAHLITDLSEKGEKIIVPARQADGSFAFAASDENGQPVRVVGSGVLLIEDKARALVGIGGEATNTGGVLYWPHGEEGALPSQRKGSEHLSPAIARVRSLGEVTLRHTQRFLQQIAARRER